MRHSIVMAKNGLAKAAGVITGISYYQARKICPGLSYVSADYFRYLEDAKRAREVYLKYTDTILPYGMDESWIVLPDGTPEDEARQIADLIRVEVKYSMGLSASVGVSFNYVFSKLGSDYKKPDATTVITRDNYRDVVWPLPASDLLFVGAKRSRILMNAGIRTIGDLAAASPAVLTRLLGKVGNDLVMFANGDDRRFNPVTEAIGSIGNAITPPEDLRSNEDASAIIYLLASSVASRLRRHGLKAGSIGIHTRDSAFKKVIRQTKLPVASSSVNYLFNHAYALFIKHYPWEKALRSVGVRADNLESNEQLAICEMDSVRLDFDVERRIRSLQRRYGRLDVERTATLAQ
jgi:DNA polymerase-4